MKPTQQLLNAVLTTTHHVKGHHSLYVQYGAVTKGMVHASVSAINKQSTTK